MSSEYSCACGAAPKLIFACSGAADVGEIADKAARRLTQMGQGKMFCLAGLGGRVSGIMQTTAAASAILAIDGCPLDCARKTLEEAGFHTFAHLRLTDMGMQKGKSPADEPHVDLAVAAARARLAAAPTLSAAATPSQPAAVACCGPTRA